MRILAGKVVLLTGASGGLGTYMAQAFAERKVKLALVAHPGMNLEGLRKSVADSGAEAMAMTSDLRDPERRREMLAAVSSRLGPIDILVNNAGVEFTSAYHELSEQQIGEVLSVNLEAPMILSRLVLPNARTPAGSHRQHLFSGREVRPSLPGVVCGDQSGLGGFYAVTAGHLSGHWGERVGDRAGFRGSWDLCAAQGEDGPAPALFRACPPEWVAQAVLRSIEHDAPGDHCQSLSDPSCPVPLGLVAQAGRLAYQPDGGASFFPPGGRGGKAQPVVSIESEPSPPAFAGPTDPLCGRWELVEACRPGRKKAVNSLFRQGICFITAFRAVSELNIAMKTKLRIAAKFLSAMVLVGSTSTLWGGGFRIPDQDAFATARGEAFAATADNASAIYYNPAGLTQLEGQDTRLGVYGLYFDPRFTSSTTGQTFDNQNNLHAIPQFFYSYKLDSLPVAVGLGVYSAYGLSSGWDQTAGFRTLGTEGAITSYTMNPTVAWQVLPNLSLGAGVKANYGSADLKQGLVWPNQAYDQFRFQGDGWAVGYDVGVLWKPIEQISLGAAFKSTSSYNFQGNTTYANNVAVGNVPVFSGASDASARFEFPLDVVCGLSYRPTTNWNFEFDADYTDWSSLGTVTIKQASGFGQLIPQNIPLVFNWQPSGTMSLARRATWPMAGR